MKILIAILAFLIFAAGDFCGSVPQTGYRGADVTDRFLAPVDIQMMAECYYVGLVMSRHNSTTEDIEVDNPIVAAIIAHAMYTQAKADMRLVGYGDNGKK